MLYSICIKGVQTKFLKTIFTVNFMTSVLTIKRWTDWEVPRSMPEAFWFLFSCVFISKSDPKSRDFFSFLDLLRAFSRTLVWNGLKAAILLHYRVQPPAHLCVRACLWSLKCIGQDSHVTKSVFPLSDKWKIQRFKCSSLGFLSKALIPKTHHLIILSLTLL